MGKPHRLAADLYRGRKCVFITCATFARHQAFADTATSARLLEALRAETRDSIELTAFCLMPDHGHFLLAGLDDEADLLRAVNRWKQRTAFEYARAHRRRLWQGSYWDWLLRSEEDEFTVARYIVSDPLRSGLVTNILDYPHWGSDRWTRGALAAAIWDPPTPQWWRERR
jgi:REP element-mobilizing transposase RayT